MSENIEEREEKKEVLVYYHVAKFPPSWGGTEYWTVIKGDEDLTDIVKCVALRYGHWDIIPGNAYEDGRAVITLKERAFKVFQKLWNEQVVKFNEVSNDTITDLAYY